MNRPLRLAECFTTNFVGGCWVFAECSPRNWQAVSSCRGRFIVPAYMKIPTKWQTEMCVWWCGNVYLIMWKHVIDNVDMRVRWNGNAYLVMQICAIGYVRIRARWIGPLRLTECFAPISWWTWGIDGVFRNQFRGGRGELAECFATNFVVDVGNWGVFRNQFRGC